MNIMTCIDREDFLDFVEICFKFFGHRVKLWSTMNEPWIFSVTGYDSGTLAPGRCSVWRNNNCSAGNSATEPYTVSHNILLAHAAAAKLYRQKYKVMMLHYISQTKFLENQLIRQ